MPLQYYHFSVDDVLDCLLDVSNQPIRLWQHPFFAFLESLWKRFETTTDLYLFQRSAGSHAPFGQPEVSGTRRATGLADVPDAVREQLSGADWLRFGPHAVDTNTHPYAQPTEEVASFCRSIYREIDRLVGPANRSTWLRLHYFSECYEQSDLLRQFGVDTLLTTDKPAGCYRLPDRCRRELLTQGATQAHQLHFVRSNIRVENLLQCPQNRLDETLEQWVGESPYAIIFTHEYELARPEVREMTVQLLDWVRRRGLRPMFPATTRSAVGSGQPVESLMLPQIEPRPAIRSEDRAP